MRAAAHRSNLLTAFVCFVICVPGHLGHVAAALPLQGRAYELNEEVPLWANRLGPKVNPSVTYPLYHLAFCRPHEGIKFREEEWFWDALQEPRDTNTPYFIPFQLDRADKILCKRLISYAEVATFRKAVEEDWHLEWHYGPMRQRIPISMFYSGGPFIYAHHHFTIYHVDKHITGFATEPKPGHAMSVADGVLDDFSGMMLMIVFSYSVKWLPGYPPVSGDSESAARRAKELQESAGYLQLLVAGLFLSMLTTAALVLFMRRRKSFALPGKDSDAALQSGSSLYAPPSFRAAFCACVGTGSHLAVAAAVFALVSIGTGIDTRNGVGMQYFFIVAVYLATSGVGAWYTARMLCTVGGSRGWIMVTVSVALSCVLYTLPVMVITCLLNVISENNRVTAAVVGPLVLQSVLWWGFAAVPLSFIISRVSEAMPCSSLQSSTSTNPDGATLCKSPIATQRWWGSLPIQMVASGLIPFIGPAMVLPRVIETIFNPAAMYEQRQVAGTVLLFLFVVNSAVVGLLAAREEIEHGRMSGGWRLSWWWRTFLCSGSPALLVSSVCITYFRSSGMHGKLQSALYFGYTGMVCFGLFLLLGATGVQTTLYMFQRRHSTAGESKKPREEWI